MATTANPIDQISYEDLYARWERGNWRSTEIDFTEDRRQWHEDFSDLERRAALWNYAMFFHGEDSVADNLSPYIDAAPREEQKYFLATQQADEARHAVFFARFMREVVDAGDDVASSLDATRDGLTWGFRKTFERLDQMADELRRDHSKPKLAAAIALYHLVIESALAQPGQHFIESYLEDRGVLPGFLEGMRNVSQDEQRHIAFGVKLLSELIAEDPDCKEAVIELLKEVTPYSLGVFVPPGFDRSYTECFGFSLEDIFEFGTNSFETKLRTAGFAPEDMARFGFPADLESRDRSQRVIAMLEGNLLGEKIGPPTRDPEVVSYLFDSVRRSVDPRHVPDRPTTIQWDFRDAEPWYLQLENGSTTVEQGRATDPDLVFRCRFEDWVDIAAGREDPRRMIVTGRLRPRGNLRLLLRTARMFG